MKARDIMTHSVRTVREDCTLEDAARCMLAQNIGCLPVTNSDGKLAGITTESDFAERKRESRSRFTAFPRSSVTGCPNRVSKRCTPRARSRHVGEFMSRAVACVDVGDELEAVFTKMQKTGFHRLPVVAAGLPVGIIARHDLLRLMVANGGLQIIPAEGDKK